MNNLIVKVKEGLNQSLRNKSEREVSTLRMLLAAFQNKEISQRKGEEGKSDLTNEQLVAVVRSEIKKRNDAIEAFEQGGRKELAEKEKEEIKILEKYLPEQLSDDDIKKIIAGIVETQDFVSQKDFGKIMGQVMGKVKGKADGNKVSALVKQLLGEQ